MMPLAAVAAGAWSQPVLAQQTYTWAGDGTALWGNSAAWVGSPSPLTFDNQTDIIFNNASQVTARNAISIGGAKTIRSLTVNADFNTDNNVTFDIRTYNTASAGAANLTFAANTGNASITVAQSTDGTEMIRLGNNNGGNVILSSNLDLAQHNTFFNANGFMFDGKMGGSGDINKTGAGHVRFVRNNSAWAGDMNINEGSVEVGNDPGNVFGPGTWTLGGGTNNTTLIVRKFFNDGIAATPGGIVVAAGSGTRTIANTANDGGGILNLSGNFTLDKDAIFDIESHVVTTGDRMTLSGTVSGEGGIVKDGTGILVLSASNNYDGTTTVSAGTLQVNGDQSGATGAVSVASAATLGGTGILGGAVSILDGGIVAPGTSPGTLTVSNAFSLADTSILSFEFNAQDTTVGAGANDLITGVTDLTLDGFLNVTGSGDWTTVADNTAWRLFDYTGTLVNNGLSLGSLPTLGDGQFFQVDTTTTGQVNLVVVPEPSTVALLGGLAAAGILLARRRLGRG